MFQLKRHIQVSYQIKVIKNKKLTRTALLSRFLYMTSDKINLVNCSLVLSL